MLFHILCITDKIIIEKNQTEDQINEIIADLKSKHKAIVNGYVVKQEEIKRIKIVKSEFDYENIWNREFNHNQQDNVLFIPSETLVFDSNEVIDVTREFITG